MSNIKNSQRVEEIAKLREIPLAEVARITTDHFHRLFLGESWRGF